MRRNEKVHAIEEHVMKASKQITNESRKNTKKNNETVLGTDKKVCITSMQCRKWRKVRKSNNYLNSLLIC